MQNQLQSQNQSFVIDETIAHPNRNHEENTENKIRADRGEPSSNQDNVQRQNVGPGEDEEKTQSNDEEKEMVKKKRCLTTKGKYFLAIFILMAIGAITIPILITQLHKPVEIFLFSRSFQANTCYILNATKYTDLTSNKTSTKTKSLQTFYVCIKNVDEEKGVELIGYTKTISEEQLKEDGTSEVTYLDNKQGLEKFLYTHTIQDDFKQENTSQNSNNDSIGDNSIEMFRFIVAENGTINTIEFNKETPKEVLGEFPKMIKLFFPHLDKSIYKQVTSRLLEEEENSYQYLPDGSIEIKNSEYIPPSTSEDELKISNTIYTKSSFNNGEFQESSLKAEADIINDESSDVSAGVSLNIIHQTQIKIVGVLRNLTKANIDAFEEYFIQEVVNKNKSLKFGLKQFNSFISKVMQQKEDSENTDGNRLLVDQNRRYIIQFNKHFELVKSGLFGLFAQVQFHPKIQLSFVPQGQFEKKVNFVLYFELEIRFASFHYKQKVFDFDRTFEPLPLDFTFKKLLEVLDAEDDDFVGQLKPFESLISRNKFKGQFIDKINILVSNLVQIENSSVVSTDIKQQILIISKENSANIGLINTAFTKISEKLAKIKNLEFINFRTELLSEVVGNLRNIDARLKDIFEKDLPKIETLSKINVDPSQTALKALLDETRSEAGILMLMKSHFSFQINKEINSVISFSNSETGEKIQVLIEAKKQLEPQLTGKSYPHNEVLSNKNIQSFKVPLAPIIIHIPTPIGTFAVVFIIDWSLSMNQTANIFYQRDLKLSLLISTELNINAQFRYGLPKVVDLKLYAQGKLFNLAVTPGLEMKQLIPLTLIQSLVDIPQFQQANMLTANLYADYIRYPYKFKAGIDISHLAVKTTWKRKCHHWKLFGRRRKFCWKYPKFSTYIKSKKLLNYNKVGKKQYEKRLITRQLAKFNYQ